MKNIAGSGRNRTVPNSQEGAVDKEEITYESALREQGIDEVFLARRLKDLVQAQGQRWNPKKGSWEKFEDYGTQLAAFREIAKIFSIYPKDSDDDSRAPMLINISSIPMRREPVSPNGEQSVRTAAGDGREHRER